MPRREGDVLRLGTAIEETPIERRAARPGNREGAALTRNRARAPVVLRAKAEKPPRRACLRPSASTPSNDRRPLPGCPFPLSGRLAGVRSAETAQSLHSG